MVSQKVFRKVFCLNRICVYLHAEKPMSQNKWLEEESYRPTSDVLGETISRTELRVRSNSFQTLMTVALYTLNNPI